MSKTIKQLAREAGLYLDGENQQHPMYVLTFDELECFAQLVLDAALEEAAVEAERWQNAIHDPRYECDCATAIRVLKEKT